MITFEYSDDHVDTNFPEVISLKHLANEFVKLSLEYILY
jgi:hypothetical protein